jgi:hypothetical protein
MLKIQGWAMISAMFFLPFASAAFGKVNVIYGEDDRRDLFDSENNPRLVELARSTAIVMKKRDLKPGQSEGQFEIPKESFGESQNLCREEAFYEQPTPGFCSAFLVGDDTLVTAGHCITSQASCDGIGFVFDFGYDYQGKDLSTVDADNVFYCKTLMKREQEGGLGKDYAVVKLDRSVVGRQPLKLRRSGAVATGAGVAVIGHPSGLPTKITDGANVRSNSPTLPYFVANLDTYGGNSGSAVFNTETWEVEGILVRGETDFVSRGGCVVSNKCAEGACRGEDVTKSSVFVQYVPAD